MRVIDAVEIGNTIEYTILMDYPSVILYLTLLTPRDKEEQYIKRFGVDCSKTHKG